jgi:hypothetical protein
MKITAAGIRALNAVRAGLVVNRFDRDGNVFTGPLSVGPALLRRLQTFGLIEDVPGRRGRTHFTQQLTAKGRAALTKGRVEP